uniref:ATP synthase F0 subunit 8 n=1 Tax=Romanomermis culicivorax TaxID=13658 RepID=A0A915HEV6_ROMCU
MLFFGASPPMSLFIIFLLLLFLASPIVFPIQVGPLHASFILKDLNFSFMIFQKFLFMLFSWACFIRNYEYEFHYISKNLKFLNSKAKKETS